MLRFRFKTVRRAFSSVSVCKASPDGKNCFVSSGGACGDCPLVAQDGTPLCHSINTSDQDDAKFKMGVIHAFRGIFMDQKLKDVTIDALNTRVAVLENDKYNLAKFVIFGQAAVAVRDKVLAPDVSCASDQTLDWWDLQESIYRAAQERRKLPPTPQTVVDNLKALHPIAKDLDFTKLVLFIHDRNKFVHRSVDTISRLNTLIQDMKSFQFKSDDPDAKLGAQLTDIVVEKSGIIAAASKKTPHHA